jgi:hypothetical protein
LGVKKTLHLLQTKLLFLEKKKKIKKQIKNKVFKTKRIKQAGFVVVPSLVPLSGKVGKIKRILWSPTQANS